jgi:hypothetical protein
MKGLKPLLVLLGSGLECKHDGRRVGVRFSKLVKSGGSACYLKKNSKYCYNNKIIER